MTPLRLLPFLLAGLCTASCQSGDASRQEPPAPPNNTRKVKVTFDPAGNPVVEGSAVARPTPPMPGQPGAMPPPPEARGALSCDPPGDWKRTAPSSAMRLSQFIVPRAKGDSEDGELAVFYFGNKGAGGVDETFQRWAGAFDDAARAKAKQTTRKAAGMDARFFEVVGTFDSSKTMAPIMGVDAGGPPKEMALVGAILSAPDGPYYFKLSGPKATIAAARPGFDKMLDACKAAGAAPATSASAGASSSPAPAKSGR